MLFRIFIGVVILLFGVTWWAAYSGWGLPTTAAADVQRQLIASRRSARLGYIGSGPRYGK